MQTDLTSISYRLRGCSPPRPAGDVHPLRFSPSGVIRLLLPDLLTPRACASHQVRFGLVGGVFRSDIDGRFGVHRYGSSACAGIGREDAACQ